MEEKSIYRSAKPWQIRLYTLAPGGIGNCFYLLMMYVSYIANEGYGIVVAVSGIIMTATRIFDGVTDPICAFISDRINTKHGKIRILLAIGWAIMALSCWLMFIGGIGSGIIYFIVVYCLYIVGYTITSVASNIATPVITNDPKQRPLLARWQNIWTMATMMVLNMVVTALFLPRYNNEYNLDCLQAMFYLIAGVSLVYLIISCIAVSEADRPENFEFGKKEDQQKLKLRDCWEMIKGNRALQMYIVAAASDKLALQTAGSTIFNTMLFGILIGNMTMSVIGSALTMPVSIIAAILATKMARTQGNKNALVWWTWFAIASAAACAVSFFAIDLSQVFKAVVPTVIFVLLRFVLMSAGQNGASSCTGAMMADIADYEAVRIGNFLPGTVAACYSFVDKLISSFSSTIATLSVAVIGYTTVMPQPNDPASTPILILTIIMTLGSTLFLQIQGKYTFPDSLLFRYISASRMGRSLLTKARVYPIAQDNYLVNMYKIYRFYFNIMLVLPQNIARCVGTSPKEEFCNIEAYFAHKALFTNFTFPYYDKQNRVGLPGRLHGAENRKGVEL